MPKIVTTYVMRNDVIALLEEASKKTHQRQEELLTRAMRKMLQNNKLYQKGDGRIKYQDRLDKETKAPIPKRRVKARFHEREYKYFQDMRRVFLKSISLVMAIAVFEYLSIIVNDILNSNGEYEDNYPYDGYAIMEKCIANITTFRIWWGIPPDLKLLLTK